MPRWITPYRLLWTGWLIGTWAFAELVEPDRTSARIAIIFFGWIGVAVGSAMASVRGRNGG